MIPSEYFKEYRNRLGFSNQADAKEFLAGKDISPEIDYNYIDGLNRRIADIISKLNSIVHQSATRQDIEGFAKQ